jgi:hypothetical protein
VTGIKETRTITGICREQINSTRVTLLFELFEQRLKRQAAVKIKQKFDMCCLVICGTYGGEERCI